MTFRELYLHLRWLAKAARDASGDPDDDLTHRAEAFVLSGGRR